MDESNEFSGSRTGKDIYVVFMITPLLFFSSFFRLFYDHFHFFTGALRQLCFIAIEIKYQHEQ